MVALKDVSVELRSAEVLAIVGENGAGKSTLIGCLTGSLRPDSGSISVDGVDFRVLTPRFATEAGIAAIRQEPVLVPTLSVAENIMLGDRKRSRLVVHRTAQRVEAVRRLQAADADIDPDELVERLSPADRQLVEIARAVGGGASVLFFDEPTAALTPAETQRVFALIRRLSEERAAIVYVSHRLEEIFEIADRVAVMRDGAVVDEGAIQEFDETRLVASMAGRHVDLASHDARSFQPNTPVRLRVRDLASGPLQSASFEVREGEIVGIAGIVGSSRTKLLLAIAGAVPVRRGTMELSGKQYHAKTPGAAIACGVALVTEDRLGSGLFPLLNQAENVLFSRLSRLSQLGITGPRRQLRQAAAMLDALSVRPRNPKALGGALSGGNQQKLVLGRALGLQPQLLLLDEPTRGVDVGTKQDIHDLVRSQASGGCSVIVVSSDLRELIQLCDRVIVMVRGRTVATFEPPFDPVTILHAAVTDAASRTGQSLGSDR